MPGEEGVLFHSFFEELRVFLSDLMLSPVKTRKISAGVRTCCIAESPKIRDFFFPLLNLKAFPTI